MTPYYDGDGITLYHGDCREVVPALGALDVAMLLTDPPYGIDYRPDPTRSVLARTRAWDSVQGDAEPFVPEQWLPYPKVVLWGANHYGDRLPPSPSWLVWDKTDGLASRRAVGFNDSADVEMAWTTLGGPARIFRYKWMGMLQAGEQGRRVHPTQKPVALMRWIVQNWTNPDDLILDPYMGSGPTAQACYELGRRYVGVEIVESYCAQAVKRLAQGSLFATELA